MRNRLGLLLAICGASHGAVAEETAEPRAVAASFLETFAAAPAKANRFFAKGAVMVMGDIGAPYHVYLKAFQSKRGAWLRSCRVDRMEEKPLPSTDDLPPRYRGGQMSLFEGAYKCSGPDGSQHDVPFAIGLNNNRVVEFQLGSGPPRQ
jgi:hypothetical protein